MRYGLRALLVVFAAGAACRGKPEIAFDVAIPSDLVGQTAWFEIGAFKDASCAAVRPMLAAGIPDGATTRVAFPKDVSVTPRIGDLPRASYAFAAVAKDETCAVLAAGCVEADVGEIDRVSVALSATDTPTGACEAGASCQAGRCVPANDNADPSVGAGCSLELLGSGPLANPVGGGGTLVSAPAVAVTPTGFVVAYREVDPNGAAARLTILPIDSGGGALTPIRPNLPGRCATSNETDGVGLTVNGEDGMVALARAPCGDKPALELLNFKTTPEVGKFLVSRSPNDTIVKLSPARAAAARASGGVLVYTEGDATVAATMNPATGITSPVGTFGGASGMRGAWVATSDKVLALLAAGTGDPTPVDDGGAPADAGTEPTLRLLVLPASQPLDGLVAAEDKPRAPVVFPGEWGSIAAVGTRVIVLSDGSGPGRSVTYRAFDLGRDAPADTNGFSVEGTGKATAGDVVIVGDRAYFAVLKPGAISLAVYGNASTTPRPLRQVSFASESRISGVSEVRDGYVAVAATDTRVAVVWSTASVLTNNDRTGGYAVFACTP